MAAYVDRDYVGLIGAMSPTDIEELETSVPGAFDAIALAVSRMFDARLSKRYQTPFDPVPEALKYHVTQVVVFELFKKRGFNPSSEQDATISDARKESLEWLKEAADSKDGLVDLPIRETPTPDVSAILQAGPLGTSDDSPYSWIDVQAERMRSGT